jgi:hypothetical protein
MCCVVTIETCNNINHNGAVCASFSSVSMPDPHWDLLVSTAAGRSMAGLAVIRDDIHVILKVRAERSGWAHLTDTVSAAIFRYITIVY